MQVAQHTNLHQASIISLLSLL